MPYSWGKVDGISTLFGLAETGEKQAELWMGAHELAPSKIDRNGVLYTLKNEIEEAPLECLGDRIYAKYGSKLPYLLKILAAGEPLSLQVHPSAEKAQMGFAREQLKGMDLRASNRNYKDKNHKPELLCALTPFWALNGFRDRSEIEHLFSLSGVDLRLKKEIQDIERDVSDEEYVRGLFTNLMRLPKTVQEELVSSSCQEIKKCLSAGNRHYDDEWTWALKLETYYPGDIGVICSLMLRLIKLEPFQAIYLKAGQLHAYLEGVGVEVMAASDNVLRGGLTRKHVDVSELLFALDFQASKKCILHAKAKQVEKKKDGSDANKKCDEQKGDKPPPNSSVQKKVTWHFFETEAQEFELAYVDGLFDEHVTLNGPEMLVCIRGTFKFENKNIGPGDVLWFPERDRRYRICGNALVFRVKVPE